MRAQRQGYFVILQFDLQKCITWSKKFGKGRHEWNKTYIDFEIHPRKLNIPIKKSYFFVIFF